MANPRSGPRDSPPASSGAAAELPEGLRVALRPWIDVEEVGLEGLWSWLESVLPLLERSTDGRADRTRELARALADCGRDRARLNIAGARYFSDNQALARRVKSLEATLEQMARTGRAPALPPDDAAARSAERYLPPAKDRRLSRTP
jgi:hypothetical protein